MKSRTIRDRLDFGISVYKEMIPENGEDSYFYNLSDSYALLSVFDGCGGLGAKKYKNFSNKTGAYMASRAASGATGEWFKNISNTTRTPESYKNALDAALKVTKAYSDKGGPELRGSMQKVFPTTLVSALTYENANDGKLCTEFFWAGDSRGYILDENGLHQITDDDINGEDAMSNLTNDGVLTNVVNFSVDFKLHHKSLILNKPSLVFCATDGCFGYLSTPMEFEYMLLDSIMGSANPRDMSEKLDLAIGAVAGDDYALMLNSFDFGGDFETVKNAFARRTVYIYNSYIKRLENQQFEQKVALWEKYKVCYYDISANDSCKSKEYL